MVHGGVPMTGGTRKPGHTIQVTGLGPSVRKTDLQEAFGEFGQIARIEVNGAKAFLEFDDKRDAKDAIDAWDGKSLKGCSLRCEMKVTQTPAGGRIIREIKPSFDGNKRQTDAVGWAERRVPEPEEPVAAGSLRTATDLAYTTESIPERRRKDQGRKGRPSSSCSVSRSREGSRRNFRTKDRERELFSQAGPLVLKPRSDPMDEEGTHGARNLKKKRRKQKVQQGRRLEEADDITMHDLPVMDLPVMDAPVVDMPVMNIGYEGGSSSQALDANEPGAPEESPKPALTVNWSDKVQEWMAKKAKEDESRMSLSSPSDNGPQSLQKSEGWTVIEQLGDPAEDTAAEDTAVESAAVQKAIAEKAEKLAAATQKCESSAVQKILDRALATRLAAAVSAETAPARAATSSSAVTLQDTKAVPAAAISESQTARSRSLRPAGKEQDLASSGTPSSKAGQERIATGSEHPPPPEPLVLRPASSSRKRLFRESDFIRPNRNSTEEQQRGNRGGGIRCRSSSSEEGPRRTGRQDLRNRLGARGFGKTESDPSQQVEPIVSKIQGEAPVGLPIPAITPAMASAATGFATSTATGTATTAAMAVPNFAMGVQPNGLGVQANGFLFGHGGFVNTATGEWLCPRCRWRNFNTRKQCVQCKLARPM